MVNAPLRYRRMPPANTTAVLNVNSESVATLSVCPRISAFLTAPKSFVFIPCMRFIV